MTAPAAPRRAAPALLLRGLMAPHVPRLAAGLCCMVLGALATAGYALLTGPVLQVVLTGRAPGLARIPGVAQLVAQQAGRGDVWAVTLLIAVLALVKGLCHLGQALLLDGTAEVIAHQLRVRTYAHVLRLPLSWHRRSGTGDLLTRLLDDVQHVQQAAVAAPMALVREAVGALCLLSVALWMSAELTLVAAAALPVVGLVVGGLSRLVRSAAEKRQRYVAQVADQVAPAMAAIAEVKSSAAEGREVASMARSGRRALRWARRKILLRALGPLANELMAAAALGATLVYAAGRVAGGGVDTDRLVSFFAALLMMYRPIKALGLAVNQIAAGQASVGRVGAILAEQAEPAPGRALPPLSRAMRLEQVRFSYQPQEVALRQLSLEIRKGEVLALAGPSGAGKSTAAALICGLEPVEQGRLLWDEVDITPLGPAALREQVALVPQQPLLHAASVAENLRYGAPEASETSLRRALEAVGMWEQVARLPQGLSSPVGPPSGIGFSVGEVQRLAVARALLRGASVVVLDEPTAALDRDSEERMIGLLQQLRGDRAVVVVAHGERLLAAADRICHLEDGRLRRVEVAQPRQVVV